MVFRDDDEPEKEQRALNLTLNSINRINSDYYYVFYGPSMLEQMAKNPAPALGLISDTFDVFIAFGNLMTYNDTIETWYICRRK